MIHRIHASGHNAINTYIFNIIHHPSSSSFIMTIHPGRRNLIFHVMIASHASKLLSPVSSYSTHTVFLLRHGETDANAGGLIQGSSDFSRLTSHGKEQAATAARKAFLWTELSTQEGGDDHQTKIDSIFVSPLTRARETLSVLRDNAHAETLVLPKDEVVLEDLREIDLYVWEGRDKKYLKSNFPESWQAWKEGDPPNFVVPYGNENEQDDRYPLIELWDRAENVWGEIKERQMHSETSSSLLVAHGSLGQALLGTAMGWDATHFRKHEFPNCGLAEVQWDVSDTSFQESKSAQQWRWRWPEPSSWMQR